MNRAAVLLLCLVARLAPAQERDVVVTGGWLFTATANDRVRNPGILIRAGKFLRVGGDLSVAAANAERVQLADTETVVPGLFDLHAHYAIELFNAGRKDETAAYPSLFLANGVTSTFPAGEMDPNVMHDLRVRIENGEQPDRGSSTPARISARHVQDGIARSPRSRSTPRSITGPSSG